jgi:small subunit ribosomal protein S6
MRHYEITCILRPSLGETMFTEVIERTCAIVTAEGGSIIDLDRWGIKKLAYLIKKESQGYYFCLNCAATQSAVLEMERIFRIDDRVLRYLTIKLADEIDEAGIEQVKEEIAAAAAAKAAEAAEEEREDDEAEDTSDDNADNNDNADNDEQE